MRSGSSSFSSKENDTHQQRSQNPLVQEVHIVLVGEAEEETGVHAQLGKVAHQALTNEGREFVERVIRRLESELATMRLKSPFA